MLLAAACGPPSEATDAGPEQASDAGAAPTDATPPDAGPGPADTGEAGAGPCPGALPERNGLVAADLERVAFAATTDVRVLFCNPLMPEQPEALVFFVALDDHLDVPPSDLTAGSSLAVSQGLRAEGPFTWEGTDLLSGEHHAAGRLLGPLRAQDGDSLLAPETEWLELRVRGIGDGSYDLAFRWEKRYLP